MSNNRCNTKCIMWSALALVLMGGIYLMLKEDKKEDPVTVWVQHAPSSADPIEFDFFVHHVAFGSVLSPLVSVYQVGGYQGVIADGWHASEDYKKWEFSIRQGMTFEDGFAITPEIVKQSLTRMGFLMKQKGSRSGMFEHLIGFDAIKSPASDISGIQTSGSSLTLIFDSPVPRLLEVISFGLYGIVHPNDYDPKTGLWANPKQVHASGPYRIAKWDDNSQTLELRKEFPSFLLHSKPLKTIEISWDMSHKDSADFIMASEFEKKLYKKHGFYGPAASGIAYVLCLTWYKKDSPCHSKEIRLALRDGFYRKLNDLYQPIFRSFLPLAMKGITEIELPKLDNPKPKMAVKRDLKYLFKTNNWLNDSANEAIESTLHDHGYHLERSSAAWTSTMAHLNYNLEKPEYDFVTIATGIRLEDPIHDIQFMVNSKEGIRLPDPTGKLKELTKTDDVDLNAVNAQIWEDGIVWPITHFSAGLLVRDDRIDMSRVNIIHPPTYFGWIGHK